MTGNKIGDEGTKELSEMLKVNTTLTSLNLIGKKEERKEKEKEKEKRRMNERE